MNGYELGSKYVLKLGLDEGQHLVSSVGSSEGPKYIKVDSSLYGILLGL